LIGLLSAALVSTAVHLTDTKPRSNDQVFWEAVHLARRAALFADPGAPAVWHDEHTVVPCACCANALLACAGEPMPEAQPLERHTPLPDFFEEATWTSVDVPIEQYFKGP